MNQSLNQQLAIENIIFQCNDDKNNNWLPDNIITENNQDTVIKYAENSKILLRRKELIDHLSDKKLEYTKYGICDSYIKFGKPSLETVIDSVQTKTSTQTKRFTILLKRLKKEGEIYDENISYYRDYIVNGGDLDNAVNEGIKEWFYINMTNYSELLKFYKDEDKAQHHAFNTFIKNNRPNRYTERIRKSELVINLITKTL